MTRFIQTIRKSPLENFRVQLRLTRTEQLRQLLSDPSQIDLDTFNIEVWRFESHTSMCGKNINRVIFDLKAPFENNQITELENGLNTGKLDLHGNYIWGSGAHVYYPAFKDKALKVRYIQQALHVLNDLTLLPEDKAKRIMALPGFGPNSATGLVMVFHPTEFAIYNAASKEAIKKLGHGTETLEVFEETMRDLKDELGIETFVELDWCLYLMIQETVPTSQEPQGIDFIDVAKLEEICEEHRRAFREHLLDTLQQLSPYEFEHFAKELLSSYGFIDVEVTQESKDGGIDGHGNLKLGLATMRVAFQCKRWRGNVGAPKVNEFRGAIQGDFEQGMFFATGDFTQGAEDLSIKQGAVPIILFNGESIVDLMIEKELGIERITLYAYREKAGKT